MKSKGPPVKRAFVLFYGVLAVVLNIKIRFDLDIEHLKNKNS